MLLTLLLLFLLLNYSKFVNFVFLVSSGIRLKKCEAFVPRNFLVSLFVIIVFSIVGKLVVSFVLNLAVNTVGDEFVSVVKTSVSFVFKILVLFVVTNNVIALFGNSC